MKNTITVKTIRGNDSQPEKAEITSPSFSIGRKINVVYDLPSKGYEWRGYAEPVELKCGKALGVFEVTDIYLNMLAKHRGRFYVLYIFFNSSIIHFTLIK